MNSSLSMGNVPTGWKMLVDHPALSKYNLSSLAVAATEQIPRIMDRLFRRKLAVTDLKIKSPSLETVFLKLTGRSLRD